MDIRRLDQVVPALAELEAQVRQTGRHAVGFVSYEAAPAFDSALVTRPAPADFPLLWFGLYDEPYKTTTLPGYSGDPTAPVGWSPSMAEDTYELAINRIKQHIAAGETYQVNFTFRLMARFTGAAWALFLAMLSGQTAGYPAFIDTGRHVVCCASPELFFRQAGEQITCRPMKGTTWRGRTLAEDEARARWLHNSEKNRAENVMIVDMLRNDLGRVAETGSVRVPELFSLERYPTVWQMTSTITARVQAPFIQLFGALFPCASITGAPKISTMRIIAALEDAPRRAYTGSIGYLAPGRQAQFNVAIRTVIIDTQTGRAEYGLGGGVVWDSTAPDEYAEALLKAHILTAPQQAGLVTLLETLRWTPQEGYFLLERHLERLADSAAYFGITLEAAAVRAYLAAAAQELPAAPQRLRLLLAPDGTLSHEAFALPSQGTKRLRVGLARQALNSHDAFLFHKTTQRGLYEEARAGRPECDDVLLYNERDELTESSIANLVVELDANPSQGLFTPPAECGLLAGTFRAALLEQGLITQRILKRADLARCSKLFLVNSVRGWMEAELVP